MEKSLHKNSEIVLKSNIEILFNDLDDAIKKYVDAGEWIHQIRRVE